MLIDEKKWKESFTTQKVNFVQSIFDIANVNLACVSKDDLIIMCDFLLNYARDLKDSNNELYHAITELRAQLNKLDCNTTED